MVANVSGNDVIGAHSPPRMARLKNVTIIAPWALPASNT
jgi:hypothetical protein